MRRSKEFIVLLALLVGAMVFVLWYVVDRRARNRAATTPAAQTVVPGPTLAPAPGPVPAVTPTPTPPAPSPGTPSAKVTVAPAKPAAQPDPVDLTKHERQTIDFSSGKAVVKESKSDQAAIDAAMKDISAATKDVTFGPTPKKK